MTKQRMIPLVLAAMVATGAGAGLAQARERNNEGHDAAALPAAKISLQQAIATAEQQTGGKAVSADLKQEHGAPRIEVEVSGPQGMKTVVVDAQSGQVTTTQASDQGDEDQD